MRKLFLSLLLLCGAYQAWQLRPVEALEAAEDGTAPVSAALPEALERLGRLGRREPAPEVARVAMVHCVIGEVGSFVRRSECGERGGTIDEPSWARSES